MAGKWQCNALPRAELGNSCGESPSSAFFTPDELQQTGSFLHIKAR